MKRLCLLNTSNATARRRWLAGWTVAALQRAALALFLLLPLNALAQYKIDRLITIGRSALYYEDYVLSIQYFNQAITAKPYLYEPWFFRAVAKYYLDDYVGAERDCSEALQRNPYVVNIYELRGLTRIQQNKYSDAIDDYTRALRYDPENRGMWQNRVYCHIRNKEFDEALAELDTIQRRWSQYAQAYSMRADVYMQQQDTAQAIVALQKSIDIDPYDGQTWAMCSIISLAREEWPEAEKQLTEAIRLMPKNAGCYINRALARVNQENLMGAMSDYDMALDLEPNNFLGHYNRGLLRAQVGDDNRAISDFDFVLNLEPDNMLALFNRAVLLDQTGDLYAAIRDYSKVIDEFPNFWIGLQHRAACYRKLGLIHKAEDDEFTVFKAQLYKHLYGNQPKLDPNQIRKRSDIDPDKYNQLVVDDSQDHEPQYQNSYRGRVQDHKVDMELLPMFALSFEAPKSDVRVYVAFEDEVEKLNEQSHARTVFINNEHVTFDEAHSKQYFNLIDSLTSALNVSHSTPEGMRLILLRAIAYSVIQDFDGAVDDLSTYLQYDSVSALALWQRAACQTRINQFQASQGTNIDLKTANVLGDLNHALAISPNNAHLLFNRGCLYAQRREYRRAVDDFSKAIEREPTMAEAYYNRGLCLISDGHIEEGTADLSKAGELGIYAAYSIIKKYIKQKTQ